MKPQPVQHWYLHNSPRFAILPLVAASDKRLSASDLRVLIVLASHADATGKCWPRRRIVGDLAGISATNVSRATSRLVDYGWLSKRQTGETSTYIIRAPAELAYQLKGGNPEIAKGADTA